MRTFSDPRWCVDPLRSNVKALVSGACLKSRVGPIAAEGLREGHFGLLRESVGDAGGREVENTGDG